MFFTSGKKRIITGVLLAALCLGECGQVSPTLTSVKTAQAESGYTDVSGIPLIPGAQWATNSLVINEMDVTANTTTSVTLTWKCDTLTNGLYYVYRYNEDAQAYEFVASTADTIYECANLNSAKKYYYTVCAYDEENQLQGEFSYPVEAYTKPKKVYNFFFVENKATAISMKWDEVLRAEGYAIYRADTDGAYRRVATTEATAYTDKGLTAGKTYRYKVCAYAYEEDNCGKYSDAAKMTTLPAKPTIKVKGGNGKARVKWNAISGASGYYLYWYDGTKYQYLTTLEGKNSTEYLHKGLKNGEYTKYKVEAYRTLYEVAYKGAASDGKTVLVKNAGATVTSPKLFKNKSRFKKSSAYKECKTFQKKVNYEKSYVIPGLSGTDVDGFYSKNMCPQGITFAKDYLLLTAYDRNLEENSVIYVMKKSNRKLLMTIVLPNKTHAGGIAYDGTNIWVTQTNTVRSIPFRDIQQAIADGKKEYLAQYKTICTLTHAASALTYYKGMLWVASYDELNAGYLGAYVIDNKTAAPDLVKYAMTRIPTRVQGLVFTSAGNLILSRSCQTNASKRGFLHVLNVYKPKLSKLAKGTVTLGAVKKTIDMPTMNEEIAIDGSYLYVNFESAAFSTAVKRMDRICAFTVKSILK